MPGQEILLINPRRKKRVKSRRRRRSARAANPRRRRRHSVGGFRRRRRHSNPRFSVRGVTGLILPAGTGALGAVLLDVLLAYVPVPDNLKSGILGTVTKAAGAIALGFGAGKVFGKRTGVLFTGGALTVIAYQLVRQLAADSLGDKVKGLSGYADFVDYQGSAGGGQVNGMGAYMPNAQLGYVSPAGVVNGAPQSDGLGAMGAYMNDMGM
jgi:hypothetical protein